MKYGIISDTHIKVYRKHSSFWQHIEKTFDFFYELCEEKKVDVIIHGGDVFHVKDTISTAAFVEANKIFKRFADRWPLHMLVGNHDSVNKNDNKINLLEVFKSYAQVYEDYDKIENGTYVSHFLPYFDEHIMIQKIKEIKTVKGKKNYLFAHCGVRGFKFQIDGYTDLQNEITPELFKKFDQVILGHFHSHQKIGNMFYVSSPLQSKHGDETGRHGFVFYDTADDSMEFVDNIYSPKFITIDLTKEKIPEMFTLENHFIRLKIQNKLSTEVLTRLKEKLLTKNYKVDFVFDYVPTNNSMAVIKDWDSVIQEDAETLIDSYLDTCSTVFDKEELKKILYDN